MTVLEDLKPNASVRGVLPNGVITVVSVQWFGSEAIELTYKDATGKVGNELLYRDREPYTSRYLRRPFHGKGVTIEFSGAAVNFPFAQLRADAEAPS